MSCKLRLQRRDLSPELADLLGGRCELDLHGRTLQQIEHNHIQGFAACLAEILLPLRCICQHLAAALHHARMPQALQLLRLGRHTRKKGMLPVALCEREDTTGTGSSLWYYRRLGISQLPQSVPLDVLNPVCTP